MGASVLLDGQESHHALGVLRLAAGDPVRLCNGAGQMAEAVLETVGKRQARARVLEVQTRPRKAFEIILALGLSKPKAMEFVIQKATELGVNRLLLVACARSVSRLEGHELEAKSQKWRSIAIEALKQCGGFWLPLIEVFPRMQTCLDREKAAESRWVAALDGNPKHPRECLNLAARERGRFPRSVEVWIGPEGDFTAEERSLLTSRGALEVSLGDQTLRTETAAIYCACVLRYEADSLPPAF